MESFYIAVIGAIGVGKSSLIQRTLGLPRPPISNASSARLPVDNVHYMITLLELDVEHFQLNPESPIQWPKQINGHIVSRVDAALLLYDVMNQKSILELPRIVVALNNSNIPVALVACKCEHPVDDWDVDAEELAQHHFFRSCLTTFRVSSQRPEAGRACLQAIVKVAMQQRKDENGESTIRRRAQSAAVLEPADTPARRSFGDGGKHSRANSDISVLRGQQGSTSNPSNHASNGPHPGQRVLSGYSSSSSSDDESDWQPVFTKPNSQGSKPAGRKALLDAGDSDSESAPKFSDDVPLLQRGDESQAERQSKAGGITFDNLVDRLLAPRLSRADNNFADIFLCLFRKFATPGKLFAAIVSRLDQVRDDRSAHYLSKTATQLRIIEVVARWVSTYPGDFARPATRSSLEEFIKHLSTEPIFWIAAQQMRRNLQFNVVEDDDTGWANADTNDGNPAFAVAPHILRDDRASQLSVDIRSLNFDDDELDSRLSQSSAASVLDRSSTNGQLHSHSYDDYEREAANLEPTDHLPMNKFRYHIFMDIADDDIADELTRIDWIMFSSIRIRDFVRHVSLSASQKEKCKSLKNVNRMISHFNHIAQWVANMILLRDKAKHRAQIMEKFMSIALKLRQLNNYNGLAAVLAGINGSAVHRLAQTRALVPEQVHRRFARLVILMGTQKSHFAYRLAWENSPLPRIPFIPLHRRDLVSAEEGSKTFMGSKGDRINWRKFEVLGEVLLPIMKSQGTAYPHLVKHDTARELILGCRMPTDDEEIYQRSVQIESPSGMADVSKKKFPWFAK